MSWIKSARYVVKNHQWMLVNPETGVLICDREQYDAVCSVTEQDEVDGPRWVEKKMKGVKGIMLDAVTAGMLVKVYEALKPEQREKYDTMPIEKAVRVGWKLVEASRGKS